jgi:hypothetical protein
MRRLGVSVGAVIAFLATVAAAPPPRSADAIVVQGERQRAQIDSFVGQLRPAQGKIQLGRFLKPICPEVAGLSKADNQKVADRMRRLARAAGVEAGPAGCDRNIIVFVVKDKRAAMAKIAGKYPDLLGDVPPSEYRRMASAPSGAASWQVVNEIGADGMPLAVVQFGPLGAATPQREVTAMTTSRLRELTVPQFLASVVIIEEKVAHDVTTTQLADYALMRALTGARESDAAPKQSILNLVNADLTATEAPLSATWWDIAFLKSLYASNNAVQASVQRDAIARQMKRELSQLPTAER